jgi:hypothetical protein
VPRATPFATDSAREEIKIPGELREFVIDDVAMLDVMFSIKFSVVIFSVCLPYSNIVFRDEDAIPMAIDLLDS